MKIIEFRNMNFTYPGCKTPALYNINFSVEDAEFVLLCGKSGCGKSTLLKHFKKNMIPHGKSEGDIFYKGQEIGKLSQRQCTAEIGFVGQNPDNQIVTDTVWHEIAFGLESLGLDNLTIKRRVAEMASFFGIQTWFRKKVSELSGGEKQLLNLASVMVMKPKLLVLDEPTSQLDPISASEFIATLKKINSELGTTIFISEHRLEELFPIVDRVLVMDDGNIVINDTPQKAALRMTSDRCADMFTALPSVVKIAAASNDRKSCPMTVKEGRLWLTKLLGEPEPASFEENRPRFSLRALFDKKNTREDTPAIRMREVCFSYDNSDIDVLRGVNLEVEKGECLAILGGNGVGKTTMLKVITKIVKKDSGTVEINGKNYDFLTDDEMFKGCISYLPQNPQALFACSTVYDELCEAFIGENKADNVKDNLVDDMLKQMELEKLKQNHPYDLSGGEQQRLALGKILLFKPKILLLDEPTKGIDPFFKQKLGKILRKLCSDGVTVLMVTHDIEFSAYFSDRCAMFFDGEIISCDIPKRFFSGNSFYTTAANRLAGEWFADSITWEEVARKCKEIVMENK